MFFPPTWDTRHAQLGRSQATINQWLFKHNQPCCVTEPHKTPLQLPTQSHLIAHRVCVGQFPEGSCARWLCGSLISTPWLRERSDVFTQSRTHIHGAFLGGACVFSFSMILFFDRLIFLLLSDVPLFLHLFIALWQHRWFCRPVIKAATVTVIESERVGALLLFVVIYSYSTQTRRL